MSIPRDANKLTTASEVRRLFTYDKKSGELIDTGARQNRRHGQRAGTVTASGYVRVMIGNIAYRAHRLVWLHHHGDWPRGGIDHINGDTRDNRIENLRDVGQMQNARNQKVFCTNSSRVPGVCWSRGKPTRHGYWRAYIVVNYRQISLGVYRDWFEAVCARKSADNRYGFHPNHGRR